MYGRRCAARLDLQEGFSIKKNRSHQTSWYQLEEISNILICTLRFINQHIEYQLDGHFKGSNRTYLARNMMNGSF